jgi:hypothetical protein
VLQVDPDFAEYLRGTCTEDALRPGRRSAGTTLLLPDKANPVRKELDKLANSDNPDDMRKAADIILAMISFVVESFRSLSLSTLAYFSVSVT